MKFQFLFLLSILFSCHKSAEVSSLSPLEKLKEGNARFAAGEPVHPDETLARLRELQYGQHPFAVVVSCSDSRVPPKLIFDQGLGDLFSVRTAGNVIGDYELGSIEYAIEHLNCRTVVVLGHDHCGAIESYIDAKGCFNHFDHIDDILKYIDEEQEEQQLLKSKKMTLDKAIDANIRHGVNLITTQDSVLSRIVKKQHVQVVGAKYHLETGKVEFAKEL